MAGEKAKVCRPFRLTGLFCIGLGAAATTLTGEDGHRHGRATGTTRTPSAAETVDGPIVSAIDRHNAITNDVKQPAGRFTRAAQDDPPAG